MQISHLALERVRLAALVERHHDHRRAIAPHQLRLFEELRLAFLERNRVHDAFALHALQPGLDHRPLRRVDHHRHLRDVRLGGDEVDELRHRRDAIEHPFVHVDVDDLRAVLDLLLRDRERFLVLPAEDQLRELRRAGDVRALADVHEIRLRRLRECFHAAEPQARVRSFGNFAGAMPRTASAIALMCGGVVPQQPPTILRKPASAHSRSCGASVSGVSGNPSPTMDSAGRRWDKNTCKLARR